MVVCLVARVISAGSIGESYQAIRMHHGYSSVHIAYSVRQSLTLSFQHRQHPGAFANGFNGFCSVFSTASFAYGGTELTGLAAAEAADPLKSIPRATKQVLWRIAIFYVVSLLIIGLLVPHNASTSHTSFLRYDAR